eukprot:TRINITY_DN9861_c0_g1_i3.p1 TRINITY_DN9861_c0_g1~~TRINITY_DN9861_c0_g1_i3.p1  ORF type:complete len:356 (-),score=73.95 TRINITY_DN9861_c0_g1_i3:72-1139(-)
MAQQCGEHELKDQWATPVACRWREESAPGRSLPAETSQQSNKSAEREHAMLEARAARGFAPVPRERLPSSSMAAPRCDQFVETGTRVSGSSLLCNSCPSESWQQEGKPSSVQAALMALQDLRMACSAQGLTEAAAAAAAAAAEAAASCSKVPEAGSCASRARSHDASNAAAMGRGANFSVLSYNSAAPVRPSRSSDARASAGESVSSRSGGSALRAARELRSFASSSLPVPGRFSERPPLPVPQASVSNSVESESAGAFALHQRAQNLEDWWLCFSSHGEQSEEPKTEQEASSVVAVAPARGNRAGRRPRSAIARLPSGDERMLLSAYLSTSPGVAPSSAARRGRPQSAKRRKGL